MATSADVTLETRYQDLARAFAAGDIVPAGRLLGLSELADDDVWLDIAGAAVLARVKPKTLTGWLTRKGPKRHPFPAPHRQLYRLYWKRSEIESWVVNAEERVG